MRPIGGREEDGSRREDIKGGKGGGAGGRVAGAEQQHRGGYEADDQAHGRVGLRAGTGCLPGGEGIEDGGDLVVGEAEALVPDVARDRREVVARDDACRAGELDRGCTTYTQNVYLLGGSPHTKVGPAALESPEQVRVLPCVRRRDGAVSEDHLPSRFLSASFSERV